MSNEHGTNIQIARRHSDSRIALIGGILGLIAQIVALWQVRNFQCNVSTYTLESVQCLFYWPAVAFAVLTFALTPGFAAWTIVHRGGTWVSFLESCWPLLGCTPLTLALLFGQAPPAICWVLLLVISSGIVCLIGVRRNSTAGTGANPPLKGQSAISHHFALIGIWVLILVLVIVHVSIQLNFFDHFQMGHADVGHFAEELKNCLRGRGLRSDSFDNIRLGWHFTPLLYILVPFFAIWPSITFLMVCGPLFLHLPALFIYSAVRRKTGDVPTAVALSLAWLALPSLGRMVYSGSYGFQWDYATVPLMAAALWAFSLNRLKTTCLFLACTALCVETASAAVMGVGILIMISRRSRAIGAVVAICALAYALLATYELIPHFALSGKYARGELFGALGPRIMDVVLSPIRNPSIFWERITRPRDWGYVAILLIPLCGLPICGWRVAIAALPTLSMVLLLENPQWLSVKFWHQAPILPIFFFACISLLKRKEESKTVIEETELSPHPDVPQLNYAIRNRSLAMAVLICSLWSHYFFGFSPVSKSYELFAADAALHRPDPRLAFVEQLRREIGRDHSILATERMAAHFWDYRRIYTGKRVRPADFVIIDRSDNWDTSDLPGKSEEFAKDSAYRWTRAFGPIIVFERIETGPTGD